MTQKTDAEKHPQCALHAETLPKREVISEFLDFLEEKRNLTIGLRKETYIEYVPIHRDTLIAEFFGIDLQKLDDERREILATFTGNPS